MKLSEFLEGPTTSSTYRTCCVFSLQKSNSSIAARVTDGCVDEIGREYLYIYIYDFVEGVASTETGRGHAK